MIFLWVPKYNLFYFFLYTHIYMLYKYTIKIIVLIHESFNILYLCTLHCVALDQQDIIYCYIRWKVRFDSNNYETLLTDCFLKNSVFRFVHSLWYSISIRFHKNFLTFSSRKDCIRSFELSRMQFVNVYTHILYLSRNVLNFIKKMRFWPQKNKIKFCGAKVVTISLFLM